jgi:hypothetical protein
MVQVAPASPRAPNKTVISFPTQLSRLLFRNLLVLSSTQGVCTIPAYAAPALTEFISYIDATLSSMNYDANKLPLGNFLIDFHLHTLIIF